MCHSRPTAVPGRRSGALTCLTRQQNVVGKIDNAAEIREGHLEGTYVPQGGLHGPSPSLYCIAFHVAASSTREATFIFWYTFLRWNATVCREMNNCLPTSLLVCPWLTSSATANSVLVSPCGISPSRSTARIAPRRTPKSRRLFTTREASRVAPTAVYTPKADSKMRTAFSFSEQRLARKSAMSSRADAAHHRSGCRFAASYSLPASASSSPSACNADPWIALNCGCLTD